MQRIWSIPPWIASRSYFTGTEKARTIITNSRWREHLVLEDLSSDMWSVLPESFTVASLAKPLAAIGIDLDDAEHLEEVENFLESLWAEGCLVLEGTDNPLPPKIAKESQYQSAANITPNVANSFNVSLMNEGFLAAAMIELTFRCNEKCIHCFNPRSKYDASTDLTTDEVLKLINDLYVAGIYDIAFTGGEVSLRDDFCTILNECRKLNLAFSVSTNGQMPPEKLERILSYYPHTIGISIYSANPEIHDAITGVKGSFERSLQAVKTCIAAGFRTKAKCPLMSHTVHGYKELLKLCDDIGAIPMFDVHIAATSDGNQKVCLNQITDEKILSQMFRDQRLPLAIDEHLPDRGRLVRAIDQCVCGAGLVSLGITPDGSVYPCNNLPIELGNIRQQSIIDIWQSSETLKAWKSVVLNDFNECGMYSECSYCQLCPGITMTETNDALGKSEKLCRTAKVRRDIDRQLAAGLVPPIDEDFGHDLTYREPTALPPGNTDTKSPAFISINHSGGNFVERVKSIKASGNPIRKTITPQADSPAALNVPAAEEPRFYEVGR
jgi:radical SAM protein with 4Fe4S-binding SPASM domain